MLPFTYFSVVAYCILFYALMYVLRQRCCQCFSVGVKWRQTKIYNSNDNDLRWFGICGQSGCEHFQYTPGKWGAKLTPEQLSATGASWRMMRLSDENAKISKKRQAGDYNAGIPSAERVRL